MPQQETTGLRVVLGQNLHRLDHRGVRYLNVRHVSCKPNQKNFQFFNFPFQLKFKLQTKPPCSILCQYFDENRGRKAIRWPTRYSLDSVTSRFRRSRSFFKVSSICFFLSISRLAKNDFPWSPVSRWNRRLTVSISFSRRLASAVFSSWVACVPRSPPAKLCTRVKIKVRTETKTNKSRDSKQAADGATFCETPNDKNCDVTRVCCAHVSRLFITPFSTRIFAARETIFQ